MGAHPRLRGQLPRNALDAHRELLHGPGDADRPTAIAESRLSSPSDRRERERRERQSAVRIEAVDGVQQADRRDLLEIVRVTPAAVLASQLARQRQIALRQRVARRRVAVAELFEQRALGPSMGWGTAGYLRGRALPWEWRAPARQARSTCGYLAAGELMRLDQAAGAEDEDLADHVRVLLVAAHEADHVAAGGVLDDRPEPLAPIRLGVRVDALTKKGDRFVAAAGELRFEADNVVVAPGAYHTPFGSTFAHELDPAIMQMHSSEYRNPAQLREGGALVVGAGNSGAEIALDLSRGHRTWLSGRDTGHEPVRPGSGPDRLVTPLMWFTAMHVLTVKNPVGRKVQRTFRSRGIPLARGSDGRTSPPQGSSWCRGRQASSTGRQCWRMDRPWMWRT